MQQNSTVLIVDDEPSIRDIIKSILSEEGYNLVFARNGKEALEKAAEVTPDLVLLDVMMPVMDGFEVCRRLRSDPFLSEVPIIMITTLGDRDSRLRGIETGADDFVTKPFDLFELQTRVKTISRLNRYRKLLDERDNLKRANIELNKAYDSTLEGWAIALELRDAETKGHSQRVTDITLRLARKIGIKEDELVNAYRGALLHDIGKMGIPDSILLKPGPLNDEEWEIMHQHPVYAYRLLSPIDYLRPALDIPYCHHEKWDGTGYPRGLKGEQIPLVARIFTVVDVWDALSSYRPYRPALPEEQVYIYLQEQVGISFDPEMVDVFLLLNNI